MLSPSPTTSRAHLWLELLPGERWTWWTVRWVRVRPNWMTVETHNTHEIEGLAIILRNIQFWLLLFVNGCISNSTGYVFFLLWIGWPHVTPTIVSKQGGPTWCLLESGFCSSTCWFMFKSKSALDLDRSWGSWVRADIVEGPIILVIRQIPDFRRTIWISMNH